MTMMDRLYRIERLVREDPDCRRILEEYSAAEKDFSEILADLPDEVQERLWKFPGLWYFLYHRVLWVLSEKMRFFDE